MLKHVGTRLLGLAALLSCLLVPAHAQNIQVSGDTYVQSGSTAAQNFGSLASVMVGPGASAATQNKALIQFDLSGLNGVSAASVQKAFLWVYVNRIVAAGAMDVYDAAGVWEEKAVNWNSVPAPGMMRGSIAVSSANQWVGLDVTQAVQGWVASPGSNFGLLLVASGSAQGTSVSLDAKESTTTSHPAQLQIVLGGVGPQGPAGPEGPAGSAGPAGPAGPQGPQGLKGDTGAVGPQGPAGATGPKGDTGSVGPQGAKGDTGAVGPQGAKGDTGSVGPQGAKGDTGAVGPQGAKGDTGSVGPQGAKGDVGPQGPQGLQGLTGPQGSQGPQGLMGPQGLQGPQGLMGPQGPQGLTGPAGSYGTGAAPTGIPLSIAVHDGNSKWNSPMATFQSASPDAQATVYTAMACTPSMKIISYVGAPITWTLYSVLPSTTNASWTQGSAIMQCSTDATAGSTCAKTASSQQLAGTAMSISAGSSPKGGGFVVYFSCD